MSEGDARVDRIEVLPDDLANQIAAGEVVERPASVVKELAENAIDAECSRIDVEIASGGVILCSVRDDGFGMSGRDAALALTRHATSKIARFEDLASLSSFGFRGEALPSIASVSRLRIETRRRGDEHGTVVTVEGGGALRADPFGGPMGTLVEVRDLFFNVPARRKFLRALPTESAHVTEVIESLALAHAGVTFTLTRDGRKVREHLRTQDREERVRDVFGRDELVRCVGARGPLAVEAYLSRPERARSGAGSLSIFVNKRPVRDRALARAVAHAYGSVLEAGRYPIGAVFLELPLETVDVNVHPQKSEVRFSDGRAVSDAVFRILETEVARAFQIVSTGRPGARGADRNWLTPSTFGAYKPHEVEGSPAIWQGTGSDSGSSNQDSNASNMHAVAIPAIAYADALARRAAQTEDAWSGDVSASSFDELTFVAQVRATYLLCESPDALVILDQHAAAERVTFDRLKRQMAGRSIARQGLLIPTIVALSPREVALLDESHEEVLALGLDVRSAGNDSVSVHAVPQLLMHANPEVLVRDLSSELSRQGARGFSGATDLALATMACHGSLRAGERVSSEEARALIAALGEVDFGGHCPHGRPIVTRLGYRELEHRVGRR